MTRLVLALSIAALLLLFAAFGWLMHWLWQRAHRRSGGEDTHRAELTARLHAAEAARDSAERALAAERAAAPGGDDLAARLVACEGERAALEASLQQARRTAAEWRAAHDALIREDRDTP